MSLLRWLPWRFLVRRLASAHGFLDPINLMARLQHFAQPSEVGEPIELLRAGAHFHARGLVNSKVIQHNLDWLWPYWVVRQFDPYDPAFIPRAFQITHVNLSNRNWTAVGLPDSEHLPIVDPRGLVTPIHDGFSLDAWLIGEDGTWVVPARLPDSAVAQELRLTDAGPQVETRAQWNGMQLTSDVMVDTDTGPPAAQLRLTADTDRPAWLALALRPVNPEGIAFVTELALAGRGTGWTVDRHHSVGFSAPADRHDAASFREGDVALNLANSDRQPARHVRCPAGLATAAALFHITPAHGRTVVARVPLDAPAAKPPGVAPATSYRPRDAATAWRDALAGACRLRVPDPGIQGLYDRALTTLVLHAPGDVYPGPYTYKRFWFRDAALIINALLLAGLPDRAERGLDRFPPRQGPLGYFRSQEGEWDSNGEALWAMQRWCTITDNPPKSGWLTPIEKGARWIARKRLPDRGETGHSGLLPAGFSAEHLGPNDYYYWDDFWGVAGQRSAAAMMQRGQRRDLAAEFRADADAFAAAIERSLARAQRRLGRPAMPAAPDRRLDAGAIGSLVASYPLRLLPGDDPRITDLVAFLEAACFVRGGFFQEMIHSGINAYLTLHVAQAKLRAGDPHGFARLVTRVAELASPTGQWPEAIHPGTLGGCMGDGQHVWAAAEWILALRNAFVREEDGKLVLGSGLFPAWLARAGEMSLGPAPTEYGTVDIRVRVAEGGAVILDWWPSWHPNVPRPRTVIHLPGYPAQTVDPDAGRAVVMPEAAA